MEIQTYFPILEPITRIRIRKPVDMHQHFRRGDILRLVAPMVAKRFASAIVMPNTIPPITSADMAMDYQSEIRDALGDSIFGLLMTIYLTDMLDVEDVEHAMSMRYIHAVKYYPRGLTTNSDSGVRDPASLWTPDTNPYEVLRAVARQCGTLLLHAADGFDENGNELDPYEQEPHFISETLPRIIDAHPDLRISVEHLSTKQGAAFIEKNGNQRLGCSLTAHHLLMDRRDVFRGGFRPHRSWWPIIQSQDHKEALQELVRQCHSFVWLGSDSAPHPVEKKESDCCAGGVLMAHAGIELYAEAFEAMGSGMLQVLEYFASINGPKFLGFPPSDEYITLVKEDWIVREPFFTESGGDMGVPTKIVPFRLGETIRWKLLQE
ncbi:MAG TPA: dihydroorotase [Candidatus Paceibacterota bacterium]|nr:dihydroorotase [Candidatus Paceibacterota bacterium]